MDDSQEPDGVNRCGSLVRVVDRSTPGSEYKRFDVENRSGKNASVLLKCTYNYRGNREVRYIPVAVSKQQTVHGWSFNLDQDPGCKIHDCDYTGPK